MSIDRDLCAEDTQLEPGVRAARLRAGLTQRQAAELLGVEVETYKHWDREESRPSDPVVYQRMPVVFDTPLGVLFPPRHSTSPSTAEPGFSDGRDDAPDAESSVPELAVNPPDIPSVLSASNGETRDTLPPTVGRRRGRWVAVAVAVLVAVGVGVVAVATRDADDGAASDLAGPAARQSDERRTDRAQMAAAASRGDFDRAIALASGGREADQFRVAAAKVLVHRADLAARRGDLALARARLRAAQRRYDTSPGAVEVRSRIRTIERDRQRRAERQRAEARRQKARASSAGAPKQPTPAVASPAPSVVEDAQPKARQQASSGATTSSGDDEHGVDTGLMPASGE